MVTATKLRGRPSKERARIEAERSARMLDEYLSGDVTHDDLCRKWGISSRALRNRLARAREARFGWAP